MFLFGIWMDWYAGMPGRLWQQSICWVFLLLSGFCLPLGHHPSGAAHRVCRGRGAGHGGHPGLHAGGPGRVRGADPAGLGHASHRCAGTAAEKDPARRGLVVSAAAVCGDLPLDEDGFWQLGPGEYCRQVPGTPTGLYGVFWLFALGFSPPTTFPLLPWLFLFWAGYFLHHLVGRGRLAPLRRSVCPPLGWMGRHSLVLYLLHQPVIYGVLLLLFHVFEQ